MLSGTAAAVPPSQQWPLWPVAGGIGNRLLVHSKSSYSDGAGNNCVEVADLTGTAYAGFVIYDSEDTQGPALLVAPSLFAAFIQVAWRGPSGR
ncbi:DUF397 domain-containing protein [Streptomyces sp. NPDC014735]|uniref:DUF397 domain-containing protein n=1 Tax=unclassified Streptomyces TaxID=2593676 RepID=UPI0036FB9AC7